MLSLPLTLQLTHTGATVQDQQTPTPRAQTNIEHPCNSSALPCSNTDFNVSGKGKGKSGQVAQ